MRLVTGYAIAAGWALAFLALAFAVRGAFHLLTPFSLRWASDRKDAAVGHVLRGLYIGLGVISFAASLINLGVAQVLLHVGRASQSIVLEADGQHLMTDVWTSVGVLAGLFLVAITGWLPLDPILAIIMACNILWTAYRLLMRSFNGWVFSS